MTWFCVVFFGDFKYLILADYYKKRNGFIEFYDKSGFLVSTVESCIVSKIVC